MKKKASKKKPKYTLDQLRLINFKLAVEKAAEEYSIENYIATAEINDTQAVQAGGRSLVVLGLLASATESILEISKNE